MPKDVKLKVLIYATLGDRLLTFTEPDFPALLPQVPGGTVESGEELATAALREFQEETGLAISTNPNFLGCFDFRDPALTGALTHRRHFFHIALDGPLPDRWEHFETAPAHGGDAIRLLFTWIALADAQNDLGYGHDAALDKIAVTQR